MTKKELVLKALNNEEVERIPVGFWFHFLPEDDLYKGLADPQIADRNVAGHKRFIDQFHPDFVKVMSDGFFGYPTSGGESTQNIADLGQLQPIDPSHRWIQQQVDLVKKVTALQADTFYIYNIFSPFTTLKSLLGVEKLVKTLKTEPQLVGDTLIRVARGLAALSERVIKEAKADGIYLSVQNPDIAQISDDEYRRYVTPSDKIVLDAANKAGGNNVLHICGFKGVKNHLNAWKDYKAAAYNWAVNEDGISLSEGKKLFGGSAVIGGFANSPGSLIEVGTKSEIEDFTEKLIKASGKKGIIIGADCTIPQGIPFDRLEWVRQKAEQVSR
ncbi:uroporphyrinogen decarboxylase family protein [Treponema primitia]|uniref:uroporphyrinogen decarboxylase family protein n=1 Tax=Treponema primitia TaxID=88058 RepID=UPI0002555154|nr:uroporphyrinogen decarboxylase family protein [Treponema primitia]